MRNIGNMSYNCVTQRRRNAIPIKNYRWSLMSNHENVIRNKEMDTSKIVS